MKTNTLLTIAATLLVAFNARAITLEEGAGTYVGKLTSTREASVQRLNQVTVIQPDGQVTIYVYAKGDPQPQLVRGFLELHEDGTFPVPDGDGKLSLNGRHLTMTFHFLARPGYPETTLQFQGHRTERKLDLPTP